MLHTQISHPSKYRRSNWSPEESDTVKVIMTRKVFKLNPRMKTISALEVMIEKDIGSVLVLNKTKIVGIITERDIVREITKSFDYLNKPLAITAKKTVLTVKPSTPVWEAFALMLKNKIRRLPIVKNGKLVGIITERDLFKWAVKVAYEPNIPEDRRKLLVRNP